LFIDVLRHGDGFSVFSKNQKFNKYNFSNTNSEITMEKHFQKNKPEMATNNLDTVNNGYSEVERNHTRYFQKWRFKNRARFKRSLISIFTLFVVSFASCGASDRPTEQDRLPFGVFPLNDVRWVETNHYCDNFTGLDSGYSYVFYDTITYSLRQIGENKTELHRAVQKRMQTFNLGIADPDLKFVGDSTWNEKPELLGWIYLEGRKVYYQGVPYIDYDGKSWEKEKGLFYDFSLNVGDKFDTPSNSFSDDYNFYLSSFDNVLVGNELRKKYDFMLNLKESGYNFSVIEGIGCDRYFFYVFNTDYTHNNSQLIKVYYKDKLIWRWQ